MFILILFYLFRINGTDTIAVSGRLRARIVAWFNFRGENAPVVPVEDIPGQKPMCLKKSAFPRSTRCPPPFVSTSGQAKLPPKITPLSGN